MKHTRDVADGRDADDGRSTAGNAGLHGSGNRARSCRTWTVAPTSTRSAACAYYMLTGTPVFSGDTPVATALAHMQRAAGSAERAVGIRGAVRRSMRSILECLAKDPAGRPAIGDRRSSSVSPRRFRQRSGRRSTRMRGGSCTTPSTSPRRRTPRRRVRTSRTRRARAQALLAAARSQTSLARFRRQANDARHPPPRTLATHPEPQSHCFTAGLQSHRRARRRTCSSARCRCSPTFAPARARRTAAARR